MLSYGTSKPDLIVAYGTGATIAAQIKDVEKVLIKPYYNTSNVLKNMLGEKNQETRIELPTLGKPEYLTITRPMVMGYKQLEIKAMENGYNNGAHSLFFTPGIETATYKEHIKLFGEVPACVKKILAGEPFSYPVKREIAKIGKQKKRVVYTFKRDENLVMKLLTHLFLREYDHLFSPNLYSFRVNNGVKRAIKKITAMPGIDKYYSYKIDISNYFNSIDVGRMCRILKTVFAEEQELLAFSQRLLNNPYARVGKSVVEEQKGVMAGTPLAVFFSNLYLTELDKEFDKRDDVIYCRYSDDIIVFAKEKERLEDAKKIIFAHIDDKGLAVNREKEVTTLPGEEWSFLGFSYKDGVIDISHISKEKLKGKMRRKARALIRWKNRKGKEDNMAVRAFIKRFNKKLYDSNDPNETNWSRWYFPIINTDKSLKEIDAYMQDCLRYTASETHTKARFNYRYEQMKALGYRNLVNEWYKWINGTTNT